MSEPQTRLAAELPCLREPDNERHTFPPGADRCFCESLLRPVVDVAEVTLFRPNRAGSLAATEGPGGLPDELTVARIIHHATHGGQPELATCMTKHRAKARRILALLAERT